MTLLSSAAAEIARDVPHKPYLAKTRLFAGYISVANSVGLTLVNLIYSWLRKLPYCVN